MHHSYEAVKDRLPVAASGRMTPGRTGLAIREALAAPRSLSLRLGREDTSFNPASTKHDIYGPAIVTYTFHADGGVDATVTELT